MPPDIDDIISIQRKTSNRTWVVSFFRTVAKDAAMQLPSIKIAARSFSVLVKIYEAPDELPDTSSSAVYPITGKFYPLGVTFSPPAVRLIATAIDTVLPTLKI